jgi:hypothetical protein
MKQVLLYFVTGVVAGLQVWRSLVRGFRGAPTSALEYVALVGCVILLVSAGLAALKSHGATISACVGLLLVWSFYGPALSLLLQHPAGVFDSPLDFVHNHEDVPRILRFNNAYLVQMSPSLLLIVTTAYAVVRLIYANRKS